MSQPPIPQIPYEAYVPKPSGSGIMVIGVFGIVLGGLAIISHLLGIAMGALGHFAHVTTAASSADTAGFLAYGIVVNLIFCILAFLELVSSVGVVRRQEWGRVWMIRWAVIYIVASALEVIGTVTVLLPHMKEVTNAAIARGGSRAISSQTMVAAMVGVQLLMFVVLMVLPVCVLIFLRMPRTRELFTDRQNVAA